MLNSLLLISLAPVFIIAFYIYSRDKYEKEPISLLLKALFIGSLCILPVMLIEWGLTSLYKGPEGINKAAYTAFIVAGLMIRNILSRMDLKHDQYLLSGLTGSFAIFSTSTDA
jgi:RsiW-degrading membrane proteinase PrsW (M82 family)